MSRSKILFMMSGSIAAFKACQVISRLVQQGHEVQVVVTPSTLNFVGAATLEGLSGRKVLSDLWENGRAMEHIHLSRWADYGVLCPASANTLARLAHGFSDDLVSALALAWPKDKKLWLIPAMNHAMYAALPTQRNLLHLEERGFSLAPTQTGALACGEEGLGRMLEADEILRLLENKSRGRILVTGGATREPIDGIRFISNVSTGQTAATLSDVLSGKGWDVTFMHGVGSAQPTRAAQNIQFETFDDLNGKLRLELKMPYAGVIHCAAVGDFSVAKPAPQRKLQSDHELNLKLTPNFKILPRLKEYSIRKELKVVGFKLTLNDPPDVTLAAAERVLSPSVDAVVANDWSQVQHDRSRHPMTLVQNGHPPRDFSDLNSLGMALHQFFQGEAHDLMP